MRPTYDFERFNPPALDEKTLRRELEKRAEQRHTVLLAIAGALFELAAVLLAVMAWGWYPPLALMCLCFVMISVAGSGAVAIVYAQKGGELNEPYTHYTD